MKFRRATRSVRGCPFSCAGLLASARLQSTIPSATEVRKDSADEVVNSRLSLCSRNQYPIDRNGGSSPHSSPTESPPTKENEVVGCVRDAPPLTADRLSIAVHGASRTHPTSVRGESFRRRTWSQIALPAGRASQCGSNRPACGPPWHSWPHTSPTESPPTNGQLPPAKGNEVVGCVRDAPPLTADRLSIAVHGASRTHPTSVGGESFRRRTRLGIALRVDRASQCGSNRPACGPPWHSRPHTSPTESPPTTRPCGRNNIYAQS